MTERKKVEFDDIVLDPITGIQGIAYVKLLYRQGCERIGVQPPAIMRKDNVPLIPDLWHVDEPQLEIIKRAKKITVKPNETGGPSYFGKDQKR